MRTLGIDPGGTTGLCLVEGGKVQGFAELSFTQVLNDGVMEHMIGEADYIGIERFFINARTASMSHQPEALYVIGIAIYLAAGANIVSRLQSASDAKTAFTNDILRELGLFKMVKGEHARDALRHALLAERGFA